MAARNQTRLSPMVADRVTPAARNRSVRELTHLIGPRSGGRCLISEGPLTASLCACRLRVERRAGGAIYGRTQGCDQGVGRPLPPSLQEGQGGDVDRAVR